MYARIHHVSQSGYAFATPEGTVLPGENQTIFCHQAEMNPRSIFLTIQRGTRIRIESLEDTPRGYRAKNIRLA